MDLGADPYPWFDAFAWVRFTGDHWNIPLMAVSAYFILIPVLKWTVDKYGKWNVRNFAFYWNLSLSLFSHHSTVLLYCWHSYANCIA